MNYDRIDYFDPTQHGDLLVCDDCGAAIHPAATRTHDAFHAFITRESAIRNQRQESQR
jgi:hypothetical protein